MESHRKLQLYFFGVIAIACIFMFLKSMKTWKQETQEIIEQQTQPAVAAERTAQTLEQELKQDNEKNNSAKAAKRSIVHVTVNQSAGSGMIWAITEDGLVIVSNRHLLMQGVQAEVTFCNGEMLSAQALGFSKQYDIAFFHIMSEDISPQLMGEIGEVSKPLEIAWNERSQSGTAIMQIGAISENKQDCYEGTIEDYLYVPEFGTTMLRTNCYAKAGMSGGGVFDREGWLLGMITGGEASDSGLKETQLTYSIPTTLIEEEYQAVIREKRGEHTK